MIHQEALKRAFFNRDPRLVGVDLLGCILVHETAEGVTSGVVVETEAYRPEDPACHAYKGPTVRNRTMFRRPGLAYVYLSYGIHKLLNVVCEEEGIGSAVLIRALRPLQGIEIMLRRRNRSTHLCDGPGRLTQALGIGLDQDGSDLTDGPLHILWGDASEDKIVSTTRVGISRGTELPWRYLVDGEKSVSVPPKSVAERVITGMW